MPQSIARTHAEARRRRGVDGVSAAQRSIFRATIASVILPPAQASHAGDRRRKVAEMGSSASGARRSAGKRSRASRLKVASALALGEATQLELGWSISSRARAAGSAKVHRLRRANRSRGNAPRARYRKVRWCRRSAEIGGASLSEPIGRKRFSSMARRHMACCRGRVRRFHRKTAPLSALFTARRARLGAESARHVRTGSTSPGRRALAQLTSTKAPLTGLHLLELEIRRASCDCRASRPGEQHRGARRIATSRFRRACH